MGINNYEIILLRYYSSPYELLNDALKDEYHLLWYHCRDVAKKALSRNTSWYWLAKRIDDFALLATQYIIQRMHIWLWKAKFEIGSISKQIHCTKNTIRWLTNRWVSILKNLFDARYKNSIAISHIVSYGDYITGAHNE